jgi:hypothetical protein
VRRGADGDGERQDGGQPRVLGGVRLANRWWRGGRGVQIGELGVLALEGDVHVPFRVAAEEDPRLVDEGRLPLDGDDRIGVLVRLLCRLGAGGEHRLDALDPVQDELAPDPGQEDLGPDAVDLHLDLVERAVSHLRPGHHPVRSEALGEGGVEGEAELEPDEAGGDRAGLADHEL